jgi:nucleoside-diphosphate-sugar epimerase
MAEELLLAYMEKYNAPIIIVRPLSVTGTGDKKEHLVPTLIEAAIEGKTMPLVPDAVHDWIDVRDVVAAVKLLVARRVRGIFEVGTGVGRTNEEVLRVVEKVTEKKVHFTFVSNMRAYDSNDWVSTNMRVRQYGWESKIPFEQTIRDMTEAYGSK